MSFHNTIRAFFICNISDICNITDWPSSVSVHCWTVFRSMNWGAGGREECLINL